MTKLRYDPPRTPGGHLPPDTWHRQDALDNEDLAMIVAARERRNAEERAPDTRTPIEFGTQVRVRDTATGETMEYAIVSPGESHPAAGGISGESPVGKALLGRGAGDTVEVRTPKGLRRLEILAAGSEAYPPL